MKQKPFSEAILRFFKLESASSILLLAAAICAVILQNSPLSYLYDSFLEIPVAVQAGTFVIAKPLLLWINDGLMAIFFFLVGLELKREVLIGELSSVRKVALPAIAAVGGMIVPALFYVLVNYQDVEAIRGWAIPSATDIAFALGVLAALGSRVPSSLKLFLLTLAIIDDLGAIIIIALFYSGNLSISALGIASVMLIGLFILNKRGSASIASYLFFGVLLWASVLKSGVHATLAGVILAMFIPLRVSEEKESPLQKLEHDLHPAVAFIILPLFAFANSGVPLAGMSFATFVEPVTLGIILGLFFGKQLGVFVFAKLAVLFRLGDLPTGMTWKHIYGVSILCGIGFTMSLFIGSLAFEGAATVQPSEVRLGILSGSILSAVVGYVFLRISNPRAEQLGDNI